MTRFALLLTLAAPILSTATPTVVQAQGIRTVTVVLQDRKFHPQVLRLKSGQRTRIVLVNRDVSGHNFDCKGLFGHATIARGAGGEEAIEKGLVSVPSQSTRAFVLTPGAPGPYNLTSSVALDVASGMQGQVLVY